MISFVIPAHNEEAVLGRTLDVLNASARNLGREFEVIVVDDASTDRTAPIARAHGAAVVSVNKRQISAARNAGAAAARGHILVFVDADTLVPPATLRAALTALERGAVGGGALMRFDRPIPWPLTPLFHIWNFLSSLLRLAAGCFIFVQRRDFQAVGGFDERYFVSEELHLSIALKRRGRLVILRQPVTTSGRKATLFSVRELLAMTVRLLGSGTRAWQRRDGLELWYGGRRES